MSLCVVTISKKTKRFVLTALWRVIEKRVSFAKLPIISELGKLAVRFFYRAKAILFIFSSEHREMHIALRMSLKVGQQRVARLYGVVQINHGGIQVVVEPAVVHQKSKGVVLSV